MSVEKWKIGASSEYGTYNANTISDQNGESVCTVYGLPMHTMLEDVDSVKYAEGLRRARLIAAAPDLLKSLQDCEARLALLVHSGRSKLLDAVAAENARAVIAKAAGEQS